MEDKIRHLRDENLRMKILLAEIVEEYGDRPHYGEGLYTRDFQQDHRIRMAMDFVGKNSFNTVKEV